MCNTLYFSSLFDFPTNTKTPTNLLTFKCRHFPNLPTYLIPEIP